MNVATVLSLVRFYPELVGHLVASPKTEATATSQFTLEPPTAAPAKTPAPAGRYVIVFSPHVRADTYLLDTQEGRVWVHATFTDLKDEPDAWVYRDRLDDDIDKSVFAEHKGFKGVGSNAAKNEPNKPKALK